MSSVIEGSLLKESNNTAVLRGRFFRVLSDGKIFYWPDAAGQCTPERSPARGEGTVVGVEEWWNGQGQNGQRRGVLGRLGGLSPNRLAVVEKAMQLSGVKQALAKQFDGCGFLVYVRAPGGQVSTYRLVAPSCKERVRWQMALASLASCSRPEAPPAAPPPASEVSGSLLTKAAGLAAAGLAAIAAPPATPAMAVVMGEREVLDTLPEVWAQWRDRGEVAAAAERYALLLRAQPSCWQAHQDRGNMHWSSGDHRRAEADFTSAIELNPTRAEIYNDRAAVRSELARLTDALDDLSTALRLKPDFAQALSNRGNVEREMQQMHAARESYNASLLLAPRDARTWNNRGVLQEQLGNLVAAELDMRRAVELDPLFDTAADNLRRVGELLRAAEMEMQPLRAHGTAADADAFAPAPSAASGRPCDAPCDGGAPPGSAGLAGGAAPDAPAAPPPGGVADACGSRFGEDD